MAREIKFRCWDKRDKRMKQIDGVFSQGYATFSEDNYSRDRGVFKGSKNEITLMQFTGLRDKNEREIYEGDIVKIHPTLKTCIVRWDNEFALFKLVQSIDENKIVKFRLYTKRPEYYEVIGNIYENPSLLESK